MMFLTSTYLGVQRIQRPHEDCHHDAVGILRLLTRTISAYLVIFITSIKILPGL